MSKAFHHVYGPVPSRRLGRSLGVDALTFKTCSFDCVYCQLGHTTNHTVERKEYVAVDDILDEVRRKLAVDTPQYMTVYSKSKNVEEAIKFLNYFYNNPEAQSILKDVRSVPPTSTARQICADNGILDPVIMQAVDYAQGMNGTSDKGFSTAPEVIQIQEDAIESVAYGTATPEQAADRAITLLEDYLSRQ